ncbi:hypothetical protein [Flavihumibacter petaseus]|uniref:Uncharacterized protein n=1 Tax=Flavihumibacter petaseus NBRC 106054 TaxID=1220578 RepID=A0A0E9N0L9_9BACT|nr:hypothetical protein [Flavihumibacter petaseus]GAO43552.1 hypothetical protein FPE01S_02_06570 [Flavihumibacter petaseus NBRC 106054]
MNAAIAIALLTKLKLIFETDADGVKQDQKFLSFQNGQFMVSKEAFYFVDPEKYGIDPTEATVRKHAFAAMFNFIAEPNDLITVKPDLLQDVYSRVLKLAIPANSHRTAAEEASYQDALAFLNKEEAVDGIQVTPLARYEQYEQLYKAAVSDYKTRQLQATLAEGVGAEPVKTQWLADEPALKSMIAKAMLAWESKGNKAAVEKWLGLFNQLTGAAPVTTLNDLKTDYELFAKMHGADELAGEFTYLPTLFNPINFFEDQVPWQMLTLDKMEVASLYEKAPANLKEVFQVSDGEPEIQHIGFEYAVVTIVREWFPLKEFFQQRFWKLPDGETVISDGNGNGLVPAYPDKMIFVRNVAIQYAKPVQPSAATGNLTAQLFVKLNPQVSFQAKTKSDQLLGRRMKMATLRAGAAAPAESAAPVMPVADSAGRVLSMHLAGDKPAVARKFSASLFKAGGFRKFTDVVVKPPPPPTPPPVPGNTELKYPAMELLAFICKKMPLCPDPDTALDWT